MTGLPGEQRAIHWTRKIIFQIIESLRFELENGQDREVIAEALDALRFHTQGVCDKRVEEFCEAYKLIPKSADDASVIDEALTKIEQKLNLNQFREGA